MDPILELDYHPRLPKRREHGIGVVGAGAIVNAAHLPAYQKAGFRVVAITDQNQEAAKLTAQKFGIARVHESVESLLADPAVEIVDIAVYPWFQLGIVRKAAAAGKHLLCQKPLSNQFEEAVEIVEIARRAGVKLAVNQQMRWDPAIRASKRLIEKGWLGELTAATINVNILTEWEMWPWLSAQETLDFMYHSIHYFDSIRFLLGEPHRLVATTARFPGQIPKGETRSFTVFDYGDTTKAFVLVNHNNWSDRRYALVRIEGTEGVAEGTLGLLYNYPFGQPDTLEFSSKHHYPEYTFAHRFQERWVPDAFMGPMADLQCAIEEGREPETAGADNLNTLRIVQAAYRSAAEGRSVDPRGIQATLAHA